MLRRPRRRRSRRRGWSLAASAPVQSTTVALGSVVAQTPAAGTVVAIGSAINFSVSSSSQASDSILHSFSGCTSNDTYISCGKNGSTGSANPAAGLIQASDGNFLHGTASAGGLSNASTIYAGTVFKITPAGVESVLHTFTGFGAVNGSKDGAAPGAALIQGSDGNTMAPRPMAVPIAWGAPFFG